MMLLCELEPMEYTVTMEDMEVGDDFFDYELEDDDFDDYEDDFDEVGFNPYMGCYDYDC